MVFSANQITPILRGHFGVGSAGNPIPPNHIFKKSSIFDNYIATTTNSSIPRISQASPYKNRKPSPIVKMPRQGRSGGGSRPSRGGSRPVVPASKPAPVQSRPATTSAMPPRAGPPAATGQTSGVPAVQQPQSGGGGGMMSNIISTGM